MLPSSSSPSSRSTAAAIAVSAAIASIIGAPQPCHCFSLAPNTPATAWPVGPSFRWKHGGSPAASRGLVRDVSPGCRHRNRQVALFGVGDNDGSGDNDGGIYYDDFDFTDAIGSGGGSSMVTPDSFQPALPDFDESRSDVGASVPLDTADLTGSNLRQFSLGSDLIISDYAGSLGFDRVTDWQYYLQGVDDRGNIDEGDERIPVSPRMDPSKPSRTRSSSGSVVRLFRGEFTGKLAGMMRSRGMDNRVWIKEYSSESSHLAMNEMRGVANLMSSWIEATLSDSAKDAQKSSLLEDMRAGLWIQAAQRRYVDSITNTPTKQDDDNLLNLLAMLSKQKAPFTALLGEMNLNDYYDDPNMDPNEWYKALGVKPPSPGSTWLVFDYHGLATASSYAVPMLIQQSKLPPKRGVFGNIVPPPPLPPFKERARYMVQGILKQMLTAVALAHEAGVVHKSIGRNSFLLSSVGQDKREAVSPYAVVVERLRVVLSDWGFSELLEDSVNDEEFRQRAKSFGIPNAIDCKTNKDVAMEFSKAEDLHALGFVFLALLFTTLAEPATLSAPMPPTDDDSWQRLFSEIFEKDMDEFRDYCTNEEIWANVVDLLDMEEGAGWSVLGALLLARERVVQWYQDPEEQELTSARMLLSSPFFQMRII